MSAPEGVQEDFGGFDPRFPGITVSVRNQRVWDHLEARLTGSLPSVPPIESSPELAYEALCASSVIYHEARHFHDFLLSPYSATILRLRSTLAANCAQLLPFLIGGDENLIPVPLPVWVELDERQRAQQLASFTILEPAPRVPNLPRLQMSLQDKVHGLHELDLEHPHARSAFIAQLGDTYNSLRKLSFSEAVSRGGNTFQSWQVFELSALLVQAQAIWTEHGAVECEHFFESTISSATPYGDVLRATKNLWDRCSAPFDLRTAIGMTVWSYCGDLEEDGARSAPLVRFAALYAHFLKSGVPPAGVDINTLMKQWSAATGLCEPGLALERDAARFDRFRALLARQHRTSHYGPLLEKSRILEVVDSLASAKALARKAFVEEPEIFVGPLEYLNALERFPDPPLRVVFEDGAISGTRENLERAWANISGRSLPSPPSMRTWTCSVTFWMSAFWTTRTISPA